MDSRQKTPSALNISFWKAKGLTRNNAEQEYYMQKSKMEMMLANQTILYS